jgi:phage terminase Nu1 subunit (DNA packaging protein)
MSIKETIGTIIACIWVISPAVAISIIVDMVGNQRRYKQLIEQQLEQRGTEIANLRKK